MPHLIFALVCTAFAVTSCRAQEAGDVKTYTGMSFLDNGVIRLGINLDIGGAITYLSESGSDLNVINSADWGRQVQMSFYSGPVPFVPEGKRVSEHWKGLGWNPIQSGDCFGNRSRVLDLRNDGQSLYVKCIPMHWPLDNVPGECTFEVWIKLEGRGVFVTSRINNDRPDRTQYSGRGQELPAVYTNAPLYRLVSYTGPEPYANGPLEEFIRKGNTTGLFPWTGWRATENWSALLRDDDWGLGVWHPGSYSHIGGFAGKPGVGGPQDGPTGYISPLHTEILDWNIRYEYSYWLVLGSLQQIREFVYGRAKAPTPPNWVFAANRQHWTYVNASDTGWPIEGELCVLPGPADPQMIGPPGFWRAEEAPTLYIVAAYDAPATNAEVFWETYEHRGFSPERRATVVVLPDGEYHTYEVDLSASPAYSGIITQLRFDPMVEAREGGKVRVKSIGFEAPE